MCCSMHSLVFTFPAYLEKFVPLMPHSVVKQHAHIFFKLKKRRIKRNKGGKKEEKKAGRKGQREGRREGG